MSRISAPGPRYRFALSLLGAVLLAHPALGQAPPGLSPRVPSMQPPLSEMQARPHDNRIVIQFRDGLRVRAVADGLSGLGAADSSGLDQVLGSVGVSPADLRRMHMLPEAVLDQQREEGQRRTGQQLPDLNNYFVIDLPPGVPAALLADRLSRLPSVQYAAPAPRPAPPPQDISPTTPLYTSQQGYRNAAPGGIGLAPLGNLGGVNGAAVQIVDIEYSWQLNHEDLNLPTSRVVNVGAAAVDPFNNTDHGTAVLGQLVGQANGYGVTGLVPAATARVAAANTTQGYNLAAAIAASSAAINVGDVILIEQQTWVCGFTTGERYGPSEWDQPVFDAIQTATANGRIVVQAAGNGNVDLDGANCQNRFNRQVRDSGAIIVGAGSAGGRVRLGFSSFGSRVDVQGWGQSVTTLGYGDLFNGGNDVRQFYTAQFGGTSSASPIVTAAVAAIQGRHRACNLPVLNAAQMRALLRETGSAQDISTDAGQIGPLPNVEAALTQLGLHNDCFVAEPTTTTLAGPSAATTGQAVSFTATVGAMRGNPTGTVSFRRAGNEFATAVIASGAAQVTTTLLPAGTHQITAHYLGNATFAPSASAARQIAITQAPPANDNFASRIVLAQPGQVSGSNLGATREAGEPNHLGGVPRERSVWWTFTPTGTGTAVVTTCGSDFDTVLAVYTGSQLNALQPVAANDDFCSTQSQVSFNATAGTAYQIAVAAYGTGSGNIVLNTTFPVVANRSTTTTLAGPTTGQTGQTLTYTATVAATGATPTGTVSFRRGGVQFATGTLNGQGVASATASFPAGTHQITAHYPGAVGFLASQSDPRQVVISQAPAQIEFVGGGTVFELTAACVAGGWANTPHPARLRYGPGETNGMPSQVGILFPSGAEHLQTWQPLAQSTLNYDALGRQMWTLFVLQQPFPRMTPVQRRITQPANGTDIAVATEVMLRLRVSGFGGIPGCGATVAGVLRRAG